MSIKSRDVCWGISCESLLFESLKDCFSPHLVKSADKYALFDYSDDDFFIEVKSRRNKKDRYPDTMVGYNKIKFFLDNPGKKSYCVFNFTDGAFYVEINEETVKQFRITEAGRRDRGFNEIKKYAFVPVKLLQPLVAPPLSHGRILEPRNNLSSYTSNDEGQP